MKDALYRCHTVAQTCLVFQFLFLFFWLTLYLRSVCLFCCFSVHVRFKWGKSCRAFKAEVRLPYQRLNKCDYELLLAFSWPVFFSSIRVRLTCFCRVFFGCFLTADRFCQTWLQWICQAAEADQSFVFFVSLFEKKKVLHQKLKTRKTEKTVFFVDGVFFFSWLPLSHDLNGLQNNKDVQESKLQLNRTTGH